MSAVVLVAHARDEHADALSKVLESRGEEVLRTSLDDLPAKAFSWSPTGVLQIGRLSIPPERTTGLWRRTGNPRLGSVHPDYRAFAESEAVDAFEGALAAVGVAWLTPPFLLRRAELKLLQLECALRLALRVPETLVTNSRRAARTFIRREGDVVAKPVRYGLVTANRPRVAWTQPFDVKSVSILEGPPIILQRRIRAKFHLRVVTVDDRVFIGSLESADLDWRRSLPNHERFSAGLASGLSDPSSDARALARELGVGYTSQDWVADDSGQTWFLEANPSGQWMFLDSLFDGEITLSIAQALEARRK